MNPNAGLVTKQIGNELHLAINVIFPNITND